MKMEDAEKWRKVRHSQEEKMTMRDAPTRLGKVK